MKRPAIKNLGDHYNTWKENPLNVPLAASAQSVLGRFPTKSAGSSCEGGCGAECGSASCVSCKTD